MRYPGRHVRRPHRRDGSGAAPDRTAEASLYAGAPGIDAVRLDAAAGPAEGHSGRAALDRGDPGGLSLSSPLPLRAGCLPLGGAAARGGRGGKGRVLGRAARVHGEVAGRRAMLERRCAGRHRCPARSRGDAARSRGNPGTRSDHPAPPAAEPLAVHAADRGPRAGRGVAFAPARRDAGHRGRVRDAESLPWPNACCD